MNPRPIYWRPCLSGTGLRKTNIVLKPTRARRYLNLVPKSSLVNFDDDKRGWKMTSNPSHRFGTGSNLRGGLFHFILNSSPYTPKDFYFNRTIASLRRSYDALLHGIQRERFSPRLEPAIGLCQSHLYICRFSSYSGRTSSPFLTLTHSLTHTLHCLPLINPTTHAFF